jgi:hypothetical protein
LKFEAVGTYINPYRANVEDMVSSYNASKRQMAFNSAFKGLTIDYQRLILEPALDSRISEQRVTSR